MNDNISETRQIARGIDGWLSDTEGELLYRLARQAPTEQAIVEIGAWKGKSTVWLAKGSIAGHKSKVFSIDPHSASRAHLSQGEESTCLTFLSNLTKAGVRDIVVPLVMTSQEAVRHWQDGIGLLWVDGSHLYEDVRRDLLSWKQHLLPGATVALHDCNQPGPSRVVNEYVRPCHDLVIMGSVDTIIWARKAKEPSRKQQGRKGIMEF